MKKKIRDSYSCGCVMVVDELSDGDAQMPTDGDVKPCQSHAEKFATMRPYQMVLYLRAIYNGWYQREHLASHPFQIRTIYNSGRDEPVVLADQCGYMTNAHINNTTADPEYCNRPRREHC